MPSKKSCKDCFHDRVCPHIMDDDAEKCGAYVADVAPVVRCGECVYRTCDGNKYDAKGFRCDHPQMNYSIECYDMWLETESDDFCSYGERRNDAEKTDLR